jgi:hypothetical protein
MRLERLRERLLAALKRLESHRQAVSGYQVTPELDSHRPYGPGDDIRYIDWNIFARQDRFYLKTVVTEDEGTVHLVIDTSASMRIPYENKLQRTLETAAAISYLSLHTGNQVILHACTDRVLLSRKFDKGASDALPLLELIPRIPVGSETDLGQCLKTLPQQNTNGSNSRIIIISDFIDKGGYGQQLDLFGTRNAKITGIQILHRDELDFRGRGNLLLKNPETGMDKRILIGHRAQKEIRNLISDFLLKTQTGFTDRNMRFFRYSHDIPFEEHVMDYFTSEGRSAGL